ncbi:MAG: hypothetical protein IKA10_02385 [Oscillospiraceae bacterium]|nr:hypothetical protein [Oscillospiraceae bacterium]
MFTDVYSRNVSILKQYGDVQFSIVQLPFVRNSGFEIENFKSKNSVNEKKLNNNITRAKSTVRELGFCNDWEYFFTFTINKQFYDRYNLKDFKKVLTQWIRDYRKKHNVSIKYLIIPERHQDGAWHFHGFIYGLPVSHLKQFKIGDQMGAKLAEKVQKGDIVYNWVPYQNKFGFCSLEPIRDKVKAVNYITKYISKGFDASVSELGAHLYFASQSLTRAEVLKRGTLQCEIPIDFENEHCKISIFDSKQYSTDLLQSIIIGRYDTYD